MEGIFAPAADVDVDVELWMVAPPPPPLVLRRGIGPAGRRLVVLASRVVAPSPSAQKRGAEADTPADSVARVPVPVRPPPRPISIVPGYSATLVLHGRCSSRRASRARLGDDSEASQATVTIKRCTNTIDRTGPSGRYAPSSLGWLWALAAMCHRSMHDVNDEVQLAAPRHVPSQAMFMADWRPRASAGAAVCRACCVVTGMGREPCTQGKEMLARPPGTAVGWYLSFARNLLVQGN